MLTCYFGVPGCGKTTLLTKFAVTELKKIQKGKSIYKDVYTNFYCEGCKQIDYNDLKKYKLYDCLIILDEITLDADNRKFKDFSDEHRNLFILHRHLGIDIIYATQSYETVDLKIRQLTQELWYMSRSVVPLFRNFTTAKRIYRNININEHSAELTLGYRFCNLLESFFVNNFKLVYRPFYYKYFDSYDENALQARPVLPARDWSTETYFSFNVRKDFIKDKYNRFCGFCTKIKDKIKSSSTSDEVDEDTKDAEIPSICTNEDITESEAFKAVFLEKLNRNCNSD